MKILQKISPAVTGTAAVAAAYYTARAFGVSKRGAAGISAGALLVHDRLVDRLWPFKQPPEKIDVTVVRSTLAGDEACPSRHHHHAADGRVFYGDYCCQDAKDGAGSPPWQGRR